MKTDDLTCLNPEKSGITFLKQFRKQLHITKKEVE